MVPQNKTLFYTRWLIKRRSGYRHLIPTPGRIVNVTFASTDILIRMQYVSLNKMNFKKPSKNFGHFGLASMFWKEYHFGCGLCSCPSHLNSLWPKYADVISNLDCYRFSMITEIPVELLSRAHGDTQQGSILLEIIRPETTITYFGLVMPYGDINLGQHWPS